MSSENHGIKNSSTSMVILKSTKEEIHRLFLLLKNTKLASHILRALRATVLPNNYSKKNSRTTREALHLLEYTMAANHGLFEEDGVF